MPQRELQVEDWGLIEYGEALRRQKVVLARVQNGAPNSLIFCSHPSVITLGRATSEGDVDLAVEVPVVEVERGGRATYHGPGQLVIYPIFHLDRNQKTEASARPRDVVQFLRACEEITIAVLRKMIGPTPVVFAKAGATGVWIETLTEPRKIVSIGIAVQRWVTFHGLALNIEKDLNAFRGLKPCGFSAGTMTSLEELGILIDRAELKYLLLQAFRTLAERY